MIAERLCRAAALGIALAAIVDPVWMTARTAPTRVVVSRADGATEADAARVAGALGEGFAIESEASPETTVRVIVGRRPPEAVVGERAFVVVPEPAADAPEIRDVRVGDEVALDVVSRVTVRVAVPASAQRGLLRLSLLADGVPMDAQELAVPPGVTTLEGDLLFVPARAGLARLRVTAGIGEAPESYADAATEVVRRTVRVLSYEARPSWAATFVRRALEEDPRFEVVVRAVTSRGVAADAGAPPATLERAEDLADFDAVVVSTPEALGERAAAALETYLRQHEGVVVLLPEAGEAPVLSRLTGVPAWVGERRPALERVEAGAGVWTASEFLWPSTWPAGAEPLSGCLAARRCAVWRVPVGGGRVVVSSAIDGWRTRAADGSGFAAFWRSLVGDEGAQTPRPVEVSLRRRLVEVGALVEAEVRVRGSGSAPVAEWQSTDGATQAVRLWPEGAARYRAEFRAPDVPGRYRLVAIAGPALRAAGEFLVVDPGAVRRPLPDEGARLAAFATAHGGAVVSMDELGTLDRRVREVVPVPMHDRPTHPMRSPWWLAPFAGLLAAEWWSRRRRGQR